MTKTYKLKYPIQMGSETIYELEFQRPKLKHLKKMDCVIGEIAKTSKMIEVCANIPPCAVDEIDIQDIEEIGNLMESFQ